MSNNTTNRVAGAAKEIGGKIEKNVGKALGDRDLESKGAANEIAGNVEKNVAKAAEVVKGAGERIKGKASELVGKARQAINR